jgi:HEPN domain-containing protein
MKDNLDVNEWIRYAQMDYDAAKNMSELHNPVPLEIVCYHCQQSAEKILKAYTIAKGEEIIRTHDLETLLERCIVYDVGFETLANVCSSLAIHAVFSRYPIGEDSVNEKDMHDALAYAAKILEYTKDKLKELSF